MRVRRACLIALLTTPAILRGAEPVRRPVVPEDTYAFHVVDALEVSPDGQTLAYSAETYDKEDDRLLAALYLRPSSGGAPRAVSWKGEDASSPRFSPDGKGLAFLSHGSDNDDAQVVVARADGKRGRRVTAFPGGVSEFDWSPDSRSLVVVRSEAPPEGAARDPWVITRSLIRRDGEGFLTNEHDHLWIVSADGRGEPRRVTSGAFDDSDPRWSPDGKWIAFVSNRTADPDADDNTDVFVVHPDGSGLRVVAANAGPDDTPRWSHAGDRIAFIGGKRANDYYITRPLMVASLAGGTLVDLSGPLDTWVAADALLASSEARCGGIWSPDDSTVYATFERRGASFLAAIPSGGGAPREITGGQRHVETVRLAPGGGRLFATIGDATHLPEIHTLNIDGSGETRLSRLNDAFLARVTLSVPERMEARNGAGDMVESWLYPPLGLDPSKRYPLILYVHGGPQEYDGDYFDTGLENQVFPGAGYAVLRVNYRGSTSYGEAFCRALWGDWHSREYEDLMAALDETLRAKPWIDPGRLGIGGWSYGGIMTLWTVGHTHRFKVAVPERFSFDYRAIFGEDQWAAQYLAELGEPYREEEKYRRLSPGTYLPDADTPLFLIADERDANCPATQAMEAYQRLRALGRRTELVIYPGESHAMARPSHLVDRLRRLLVWFGRYLAPAPGKPAETTGTPPRSAKMPSP